MKALLLVSTLGLTLLANTAIAAASSEDSSAWRNAEASTVVTVEQETTNDWKNTEFSPVEKAEDHSKTSQNYRRIKF